MDSYHLAPSRLNDISNDPTDITDQNCDRKRPEQQARLRSRNSVTNMSSVLMSKTVTPFLREHIPSLYAPIGKPGNQETARAENPNSKYCYRHHPDSKCRRAADKAKMVMIQSELDKLTSAVGLQYWKKKEVWWLTCTLLEIGSASCYPRVVPVLRRPCPTPRPDASGYPLPALLPTALVRL